MAIKYHKKGIHELDELKKLTYLSAAVSFLLVSTDHLLNWMFKEAEHVIRRYAILKKI